MSVHKFIGYSQLFLWILCRNRTLTLISQRQKENFNVFYFSVGSLIADSVAILMQRSPKALDHSLPEAYQKVMQLEGVQGVHETHFWTLCSNYYCGGLKLEVSANADAKYIVR